MNITKKDLLDAGCHFGHLTRKWNPKMAPYIFTEKNGLHIIDLNKTHKQLIEICKLIQNKIAMGRRVLFVATKKQAKDIVASHAIKVGMPYVTERWLGGMLTNFSTIRKSLNKMSYIERLMKSEEYENLAKREKLMKTREKDKLNRILGGIAKEKRLPDFLFVVDVKKEHIAVKEARKLGIPVFAIVDTNSDPTTADFMVTANDDASKSIQLIVHTITEAIQKGLDEKKLVKSPAPKSTNPNADNKENTKSKSPKPIAKSDEKIRVNIESKKQDVSKSKNIKSIDKENSEIKKKK